MLSPDENPFMTAHKPVEDGFPFVVETDSLADSMGLRLPNRSLYLLQGKVGAGKSLIAQRLIHGMVQNGVKVLVIVRNTCVPAERTFVIAGQAQLLLEVLARLTELEVVDVERCAVVIL